MNYEQLREMRNNANPFAQLLGIRLTGLREGLAVAEMEIKKEYTNPVGTSHGGVLFTLADVAAGAAAASYGNYAVTVSSEYHYLKSAAEGNTVRAEAKAVKAGRRIIVLSVDVTEAESGELLGSSMITYSRLEEEIAC